MVHAGKHLTQHLLHVFEILFQFLDLAVLLILRVNDLVNLFFLVVSYFYCQWLSGLYLVFMNLNLKRLCRVLIFFRWRVELHRILFVGRPVTDLVLGLIKDFVIIAIFRFGKKNEGSLDFMIPAVIFIWLFVFKDIWLSFTTLMRYHIVIILVEISFYEALCHQFLVQILLFHWLEWFSIHVYFFRLSKHQSVLFYFCVFRYLLFGLIKLFLSWQIM